MQALVIGAHPDDVEIGAAGLIQRLLDNGASVDIVVVADEADHGEVRRSEAIAAARELGIPAEHVHALGLEDGSVGATPGSVEAMRVLCEEAGIRPALVVTHTSADSHQDHRAVNELCRAAFRECVLLLFSIYLSGEPSSFRPSLFVDLDEKLAERKRLSLECHASQRGRLDGDAMVAAEEEFGGLAGLDRAEAFEILQQRGADDRVIYSLNDSVVHRFFHGLGREKPWLLVGNSPRQTDADGSLYSIDVAYAGLDAIRASLQSLRFDGSQYRELAAESHQAFEVAESHNVVLAGGPLANRVTREFVNHGEHVDWVIDYTFKGRRIDIFALEQSTRRLILAETDPETGRLTADFGVLTIMPHPFDPTMCVVSCAGIHGPATQALLRAVAVPSAAGIVAVQEDYYADGIGQAVFRCDPTTLDLVERVA